VLNMAYKVTVVCDNVDDFTHMSKVLNDNGIVSKDDPVIVKVNAKSYRLVAEAE